MFVSSACLLVVVYEFMFLMLVLVMVKLSNQILLAYNVLGLVLLMLTRSEDEAD